MGRHWPNGGSLGPLGRISGVLPCCRPWPSLNPAQIYFFTVVSGYGTGQRGDQEKYNSVYSMTGLNSDTGLGGRSDPWDSRVDPASGALYGHVRQESTASETGMLDNPGDAPRQVVPAPPFHSFGQSSGSNYSQQDSYKDPYYRDPQRPQ